MAATPPRNGVTTDAGRKVWDGAGMTVVSTEHLSGVTYDNGPEDAKHFDCPYGCGGMRLAHTEGLEVHRWDCVWWQREGKDETPFDLPDSRKSRRESGLYDPWRGE